jgi:hypothetical protein
MFKMKTVAINISKSNILPIRQLIAAVSIWTDEPTVEALLWLLLLVLLLLPPGTVCAGRLKVLDST